MGKRYSQRQAEAEARASIDKFMGRGKGGPRCTCTNHMGGSKQQFKTREAALTQLARTHLNRGGTYQVYPCPTTDRFHITSRPKRPDPKGT